MATSSVAAATYNSEAAQDKAQNKTRMSSASAIPVSISFGKE
jgi:hypothetical protein